MIGDVVLSSSAPLFYHFHELRPTLSCINGSRDTQHNSAIPPQKQSTAPDGVTIDVALEHELVWQESRAVVCQRFLRSVLSFFGVKKKKKNDEA